MDTIAVIPRLSYNPYIKKWEPILFLPEGRASLGCLVCYAHAGHHSGASLAYYLGTRPVKRITREVRALLNEYKTLEFDVKLKILKRRPARS